MRGFTCREKEQYFEDFLQLAPAGESFVDAGGFDGYTSLQFIRICPEYQSINVFEPDPENFSVCNSRLPQHENIKVHDLGLSDSKKTLKFEMGGVRSRITDVGSMEINVDRLDDVLSSSVTFIKMDIEGAEISAIDGAAGTINEYHPRLGICVYHGAGAFWEIPKKVLSIRDDYRIYLRHYTESIYETVMFFIPIKQHVYGGGWRVR
ncbi:MAG: FkbM family methyltransferase [Candidatus Endonucleobacter bathymodioli]|uniref:FkbM family methyltransferase n=1 Tax=Candidatus Endonucleibacter bathymodioli TaxID=539814 RepID=A0AA90P0Z9_9GAMM|nr:FkbM family methyltransferase [Candidatus Endonucleobacter bathymodioli]